MSMKNHFENMDVRQGVQARWNTIKSKMEQLMLFIDELEKLQRALPANLRDAKTLQDRLVSACRGISECDYALQIPHTSYEGLVAALRQSIVTTEANERTNMNQRFNYDNSSTINTREKYHKPQRHNKSAQYAQDHDYKSSSCNENVAYYTNRIYKGGRDRKSTSKGYKNDSRDRRGDRKYDSDKIICFICRQRGHRSTDPRHTDAERSKQYKEWEKTQRSGYKSRSYYYSFLAEIEGESDDDDGDGERLIQQFQSQDYECTNTIYITEDLGSIDGEKTLAILDENAAYHTLTKYTTLLE
ncbi:integrase and RNaseH domain-containing protein [Golovinomyces cichoracearum]|uniref:Integrase and RNaseH domain-containing protein n=1 Tax=Golovinomyces cichoracearum TaxID=62708 RepID=A0A420IVB2_9PEZI|nr:integrase and RNaseH domain-containing protein [Golovinomyces cichoracearum]